MAVSWINSWVWNFGSKNVLAVKCNRFCQTSINKRDIISPYIAQSTYISYASSAMTCRYFLSLGLIVKDILTWPPEDTVQSLFCSLPMPPLNYSWLCASQRAFAIAFYLILSHGVWRTPSRMWGPKSSSDWSRVPRWMESREEKPVPCLLTKYLSQHTTSTQRWWWKSGKSTVKEVLSDRN